MARRPRSVHTRSLAGVLALLGLALPIGASAREIGVYSGRHYNTDKALY